MYVKHFLSTPVMYECVFKEIALKKVKLYKSAEYFKLQWLINQGK